MGTRTQSVDDPSTKCRLLYGPQFRKPTSYKSVLCAMCDRVRTVWEDDSILLFRITELLLAALQFADPYLWFAAGAEALSKSLQSKRKNADEIAYRVGYAVSDAYILARLIIPLVLLSSAVRSSVWYWVTFVLVRGNLLAFSFTASTGNFQEHVFDAE
jgi:hypothetical protein